MSVWKIFNLKFVIIFVCIVYFVLIQISGRFTINVNGAQIVQYGFPIRFIEIKGEELTRDNSFDFEKSPWTTKFFAPIKPYRTDARRIVNPKRPGFFIWEHDVYNPVTNAIHVSITNEVFLTHRISDFIVFYLPLANVANREFNSNINGWVYNIQHIPWRCALFNFLYLLVVALGTWMFLFQIKNQRLSWFAVSLFAATTIYVSIVLASQSVYNILHSQFADLSTYWFYQQLFAINAIFFYTAMTGYVLFLVNAFKLTVPDMENKILSTPAAVINALAFPILIALSATLKGVGYLNSSFDDAIWNIVAYPIFWGSPIAGLLIAIHLIYKRQSVSAALLFVVLFGLFELWFCTNFRSFG